MPRNSAFATFTSVSNQPNGGANVLNNITLTDINANSSSGGTYSLTTPSTNATISVPTSGLYEVTMEASIANSSSDDLVSIWARTGTTLTPIPRSRLVQTVANNHRVSVTNVFTINLTPTTPLTFAWSSTNGHAFLETLPVSALPAPSVPSFTVVMKQMTTSYRPENVWYVSKDSISNRAVDGGFESPYSTVAAAIAAAEAVSTVPIVPQVIVIAPGTYNEGALTINKGYLTFIGMAPSQNVNSTTTIAANWNINITSTANNLYGNQVVFSNLTLTQATSPPTSIATVTDVSTRQHSVIFKNVQLYGRNRLLNFVPTGAGDGRLYIEDCELAQTAEAVPVGEISDMVTVSVGAMQMVRTSMVAVKNTTCLRVNGTAAIYTMTLCNFQSTTADAAALPIVRLESGISYPTGLSMCGFLYTSATPKDPAVSCGIKFGGVTGQQLILTNVLFGLVGLPYSGYAVDVEGPAIHQVLANNASSFPGTAYLCNVPVSKVVGMAPILGI
jgi:hypothetical protein